MNIRIRPVAVSGNKRITDRQVEVLDAVRRTGSINSAAKKLGITAAVAFRHIRELESIAGENVLISSPRGSILTEYGSNLLRSMKYADERLSHERRFTVACSPVTEELLMSVISSVNTDTDLVISDDEMNMRSLRKDEADIVILDDPVHVFDDDSLQWKEIGRMDMIHVNRGQPYMRYRYGAQRIAFRHLDAAGKEYTLDGETLSLNDLLDSGKSFFIDEILLIRKGIKMHSSTDPSLLRHSILAVYKTGSERIDRLLNELNKKRL